VKTLEAQTYTADIYIAGDYDIARQVCREYCMRGQCVTVTPTTFTYTGGEEVGVRVGFINYPRFPKEQQAIWDAAIELAQLLIERLCQHSALVIATDKTQWMTRREDGK